MAKTVKTKKNVNKGPTQKDLFFDTVGEALANTFPDYDVIRMKPTGTPEGILITVFDQDYYLVITEKKQSVFYETEDIRRDYSANASKTEDEETTAEETVEETE